MVIAFPQNLIQSNHIKVENFPHFNFAQAVKLFEKGQDSRTYKVYGIAISNLTQDEDYGFWEARYIYALYDAESKPSTVNLRWEYESDLVTADSLEDTEF